MTTTALTTTASRANEIYAKIENPLQAITELGNLFHKSQIMGINTPGDGAVLALTCMCDGITPLEFAKTYHIINGRPSMRADMMSAKFRGAGGKVSWINLGDEGKLAEATFEFEGQSMPIRYTIEDAKNAVGDKLDKPDSNWRKDRGAMLRARLITKAIRILAPELIAGVYTPEELEDAGVSQAPQPAKKSRAERAEELKATETATIVTGESTPDYTPEAETIIDAVTESPPFETTTTESATDDSDEPATPDLLQELVALGKKIPSQANPGSAMDLREIADGVCKACKVEKPQQATRKQIRALIAKFRATLGEK
ncbi:MAG TPA: hypothetical protein PLY87_18900 [Planctomycetaceae bacterium]|nr:hypothetical protein [Planctomycetaceae bacterium]